MSNNVILSKSQERDIPTETPSDKAKPVAIDQATKQKALQEKQYEQALEKGQLLTPQQRLYALNKLTQGAVAAVEGEFADGSVSASYELPQGKLLVWQHRNKNSTSFNVTLIQRDTAATNTHHSCHYNSEGSFKFRSHSTHTTAKIDKDGGRTSMATPKERSNNLWSEKYGDKLIKEALELFSKGKNHLAL